MSSGMKHLRITGRDLRIAKINKKVRVQPCAKEFSAFISAVEMYGDGKVPLAITKQLTDCMEVKSAGAKQTTLMYHLSRYVKKE